MIRRRNRVRNPAAPVSTLSVLSVRAAHLPRARRRRRARARLLWQWSLFLAAVLVLGARRSDWPLRALRSGCRPGPRSPVSTSPDSLPPTPGRCSSNARVSSAGSPVVFTANGKRWRVKPDASSPRSTGRRRSRPHGSQGEGFGPIRGLKRLGVRVFGGEVAPRATVYQTAIDSYVTRFATAVDHPRAEPYLRLRGPEPEVVPGQAGTLLDRSEAQRVLVRALTGLAREPVALPLRADRPHLATADLAGAKVKAETALSAPVDLAYEDRGSWHLTRVKIARLLALPRNGSTELELAGPLRAPLLRQPPQRVEHPPKDATFRIGDGNHVRRCRRPGRTTGSISRPLRTTSLAAMLSTPNRRADLRSPRRPPSARQARRGRWGSPGSSAPTRRSTAACRTGSTTSSSSRT